MSEMTPQLDPPNPAVLAELNDEAVIPLSSDFDDVPVETFLDPTLDDTTPSAG